MAARPKATHTDRVTELLRIVLRVVGMLLPGAAVLVVDELRGGGPDGDFGTFLGAMALSFLVTAGLAGSDAASSPVGRVVLRWVVAAVVLGVGLGVTTTVLWPGGPTGAARVGEALTMSLFYLLPLLLAVGIGLAGAGTRGTDVS
jgi:hypothetical protein